MKISRERKVFLAAALAASIASVTGFNVYARMTIGSETLFHAVYESLYYSGIQIIGTILLEGDPPFESMKAHRIIIVSMEKIATVFSGRLSFQDLAS